MDTPALVVFDETCDLVPVPYSILERVHAQPLSLRRNADPVRHRPIWHELGRKLAMLHANVATVADPHGDLDPHHATHDPEPLIADLERQAFPLVPRRPGTTSLVRFSA